MEIALPGNLRKVSTYDRGAVIAALSVGSGVPTRSGLPHREGTGLSIESAQGALKLSQAPDEFVLTATEFANAIRKGARLQFFQLPE